MLKTSQTITLQGTSTIDGENVVNYSTNITTSDGVNTYISHSIVNKALYEANKGVIRKETAAFQEWVYKHQDNAVADIHDVEEIIDIEESSTK